MIWSPFPPWTQALAAAIVRSGVPGCCAPEQPLPSDPVAELTKKRRAPERNGRFANPFPSTPTPIDVSYTAGEDVPTGGGVVTVVTGAVGLCVGAGVSLDAIGSWELLHALAEQRDASSKTLPFRR